MASFLESSFWRLNFRGLLFLGLPSLFVLVGCGPGGDEKKSIATGYEAQKKAEITESLDPKFGGIVYDAEISGLNEDGYKKGKIRVSPQHAMSFAGGVLFGGDRGEWGGELIYRDSHGMDRKFLDKNVKGIFSQGDTAIIFTGLNHLGFDEGEIYLIEHPGEARIAPPVLLHRLVGSPEEVFKMRDGYLISMEIGNNSDDELPESNQSRCFFLGKDRSLVEHSCKPRINAPTGK